MNEIELKKYVGNRIKEERKKRRMSQKELGEKIGVKHNTISSYENATNAPEQESLFKIAKALNISVDDLFPPFEKEEQGKQEFGKALQLAENLNIKDINLLKEMIEKALSLEADDREKFFDNIRFAVEFFKNNEKI
ncbi:helix-turn-helix domain-containing protein [Rummeliibacillus stabekisii]|uniref:HTH cro/C1-type domain-containing protein n=1 Tax=Rummeliibacillus stabekisii TaxID=241244 RepID=A0A143HDB4_9BACL|nr:helix-turn-helix domain-containing protein [Rummeliibacillus stabekisii]AMW99241.1 hypothetical protein ATY39_07040 [Rummeliibacillus stabekisii]